MCPECAARQAVNDRLLRLMDEREQVLIDAFLKHLLRAVDRLDRHAPGTTEAHTLDRVRRRSLSRVERHALGRAKAAIARTLRQPRPLTNGQRAFVAHEQETTP